MDAREERSRRIMDAIREVLLHKWDPIGVADVPGARDEYDGYVGGVYRLIASCASPAQIAEHLATIEREKMGFEKTTAETLLSVATELAKVDVAL